MALPDFLLVGAPKAGTTAVHVALSRHPQVFMSTPKEPKYFLSDDGVRPVARGGPGDAQTIQKQMWRRADYEALFDAAPAAARRGESTTLYLADSAAHRRIHTLLPQARLVAVLRDPVDRAHSNWTHLRSAGLEPVGDFIRACDLEAERTRRGWAQFWRYVSQGRYGEQLEHLFSGFPRDQVLVVFYRELREQPVATLDRICAFLGVDTGVITEVPVENVTADAGDGVVDTVLSTALRLGAGLGHRLPSRVRSAFSVPAVRYLQRQQRLRSPLRSEERAALIPRFEDDIRRLERLLDVDLAHWRDLRNGLARPPLHVAGRFGTGYRSIDRPR